MTNLPPKNKKTRENDNRVNTELDTTPVHLTDQIEQRNKKEKHNKGDVLILCHGGEGVSIS